MLVMRPGFAGPFSAHARGAQWAQFANKKGGSGAAFQPRNINVN